MAEGARQVPALLVVSHGNLADELVQAARTIVGDVEGLEVLSIAWDDPMTDAGERVKEAVERLDRGRGVLLLTDMFGGTPTNLALSLHAPEQVEIITGVNLPMLIKFASLRDEVGLAEAAQLLHEQGREAIQLAGSFLTRPDGEAEETH